MRSEGGDACGQESEERCGRQRTAPQKQGDARVGSQGPARAKEGDPSQLRGRGSLTGRRGRTWGVLRHGRAMRWVER